MSGLSLPGVGQSLPGVGASLVSGTQNMPAAGESLLGIGVSLVIAQASSTATVFNFSVVSQSQYVPVLLGGFA